MDHEHPRRRHTAIATLITAVIYLTIIAAVLVESISR